VTTVSYDITTGSYEPVLIDSHDKSGTKYTVLEAMRSSTACPTCFKGKEMTVDGAKKINYDGCIFANNPSAYGIAIAALKVPLEDIVYISVGTGHMDPNGSDFQYP